jgi:hypothetical protein
MTTKSINIPKAGWLPYTNAFSASMGDTAYALGEVGSQELDILDKSNNKSIRDNLREDNLNGIISNMEAVQRTPCIADTVDPKRSSEEEQNNDDMVRSPWKSTKPQTCK